MIALQRVVVYPVVKEKKKFDLDSATLRKRRHNLSVNSDTDIRIDSPGSFRSFLKNEISNQVEESFGEAITNLETSSKSKFFRESKLLKNRLQPSDSPSSGGIKIFSPRPHTKINLAIIETESPSTNLTPRSGRSNNSNSTVNLVNLEN